MGNQLLCSTVSSMSITSLLKLIPLQEPKEMAVTHSLGPLAETPSAALSTIPQMAASPALAPIRTSTATSLQAPIGELSSQAAVEPAEV